MASSAQPVKQAQNVRRSRTFMLVNQFATSPPYGSRPRLAAGVLEHTSPRAGYSSLTTNRSDHDIAVDSASSAAIASRPAENEPVASPSHPTAYGRTTPP